MWIPAWLRKRVLDDEKAAQNSLVLKLRLELVRSENLISELRAEKMAATSELKKYKDREFIDFEIGDPVPTDVEKRRAYVSAVAGLYHDILHPKLKHMIAVARSVLENPDNTEKQDEQIKGTIYALFELIRWGNLMAGEDKASMRGENPSSPKDAEK